MPVFDKVSPNKNNLSNLSVASTAPSLILRQGYLQRPSPSLRFLPFFKSPFALHQE
jgi:hypothetical protein